MTNSRVNQEGRWPLHKRYANLLGCAPFEPAMPHAAITKNQVECLRDTNRVGDNEARARFREIAHSTFGAGARSAMGNAGALEHSSSVRPASIGGHQSPP